MAVAHARLSCGDTASNVRNGAAKQTKLLGDRAAWRQVANRGGAVAWRIWGGDYLSGGNTYMPFSRLRQRDSLSICFSVMRRRGSGGRRDGLWQFCI